MFTTYLFVATGGALGSVSRHWIGLKITERFGESLPWGTLVANVTGSFLIGCLAALSSAGGTKWSLSLNTRSFLIAGFCGGYTTFSAFSLQNWFLLSRGDFAKALLNIGFSVVGCLVASWLGFAAVSMLADSVE